MPGLYVSFHLFQRLLFFCFGRTHSVFISTFVFALEGFASASYLTISIFTHYVSFISIL